MNESLDLGGVWQLGWGDGTRGVAGLSDRPEVDPARYLEAQVPGEVHLDLERAGLIDDVRIGINALKARWVEEMRWIYRKEFQVPAAALEAPGSWLVFEGLDLVARIVLNGEEIGKHEDSYFPCRLNVTGKLKPGKNVLVVHLESGLYDVADKPLGRFQYAHDHRLNKRHWLRKAQCQFGWDWSIRLLNVGIFRPARLEWASHATVTQVAVTADVSENLQRGTVRARVFVDALKEAKGKLNLQVGGVTQTIEVQLNPGLHQYVVEAALEKPELWWPAELGLQRLYPTKVTLTIGNELVTEKQLKVGFRKIHFNQQPHPDGNGARYFILEVNNRKVFAKGANWAPGDMILSRCNRESYAKLLNLAREAHFNFFRINGCGIYEEDAFYERCDELGLMIWQDFPFTNIHYPFSDPAFLQLVETEARFNVRRLQSHPSLIVWCGNNEMEWLGGNKSTIGTEIDDVTFFHKNLAQIVAAEDPNRYYQPSSPFSPDDLEPNASNAGNQHPWDIGMANTDFHGYRKMTSRFATEGGLLGSPALPTVRTCLQTTPVNGKTQQQVWSFAWQQHDNSIAQIEHPSWMDQTFTDWLGKDIRQTSVEEYCYYAGVLQGEALREYADNFRRRMFDSAAVAFWDFNDFWPATRGWAIVDNYFRRATAFYAVRRAYRPISVVVVCENDEVAIYGINDANDPCNATLRFGIFELAGRYPLDESTPVTLAPNASTRLKSFKQSQWPNPETTAAFAVLTHGSQILARNRLFLKRFKDLTWPTANITVKLADGRATFETPTFAWAVCLDLDGEKPRDDNFFDLYPNQPFALPWQEPTAPKVLRIGNLSSH